MNARRWFVAALFLGAALVVVGCAQSSGAADRSSANSPSVPATGHPSTGSPSASTTTLTPPVDGVRYLSTSVAGRDLVKGTTISLRLSNGTLTAAAGCNTLSAPAAVGSGRLAITEPVAMTELGCPDGRADQDLWLAAFLQARPILAVSGSGFTLTANGVTISLQPQQTAPLEGTIWELTTVTKGDTGSGWANLAAPRIWFGHGTVDVNTGCNIGSGPVTIGSGQLTFGPLMMTQVACDNPIGEIEKTMVTTMTGTVDYRLDGTTLTLERAGTGLVFRATSGDLTPSPVGGPPTSPAATSTRARPTGSGDSGSTSAPETSVGVLPPSERDQSTSPAATTNSLNRKIPEPPPTDN